MPVGLITMVSNVSAYVRLIESISTRLRSEERVLVVNLSSQQTPNLKAALKHVNRQATNQSFDADDEDAFNDTQQVVSDISPWLRVR